MTALRPSATYFRRCPAGFFRIREFRPDDESRAGANPFLLVHGLGVSSAYFQRLVRELVITNPVLTIDLPAFGGVPRAAADLTVESLARMVVAALAEFAPAGAHLLGHSMGAQVALEAALSSDADLRSLTLLGLPAHFRRLPKLRLLARFLRSSVHEPLGLVKTATRAYLQCGLKNFVAAAPATAHYPAIARLRGHSLPVPVAVLRGEYDYVCAAAFARELAAALTDRSQRVAAACCDGQAHSVLYQADEWLATVTLAAAGVPGPTLAQRLRRSGEGDEEAATNKVTAVVQEVLGDAQNALRNLRGDDPPSSWNAAGTGLPVVLLPGINETWRVFESLAHKLNRAGHRIVTVPQLGRSVPEPQVLADLVWHRVRSLGIDEFLILAHSKGGLVAQALLRDPDRARRVRRVVTVGTPFAGSPWANLFPRRSQVGRLRPRAPFFSTEDGPDFPAHKFRVVRGRWDPKLLGPSRLEGAEHFELHGSGHALPLRQAALHDLVLQLFRG